MKTLSRLRLLGAFVAMLAVPAVVQADFYSAPYYYATNGDGTVSITGYNGSGGALTITNTINGLPVTSIGSNAFYLCTSLTSVTISN